MTSKNSSDGFFRIFRAAYLPAAAAMTVICAVITVLWLFELPYTDSVFNPFEDFLFMFIFCAFSGLAGALAFGTSILKRSSNVYLSLGVSRQKQYVARWLAGFTAVFSAIVFVFLLVGISCVRTNSKYADATVFLPTFLYIVGGFLVIYAIMALTYSCGNNIFESAVLAFILFLCMLFADTFYDALQSIRFGSTYESVLTSDQSEITEFFASVSFDPGDFLCPFCGILNYSFLGYSFEEIRSVSVPYSLFSALVSLIYLSVLFFLGYIGFGKKTAENCGKLFKSAYIYKITGVGLSLVAFKYVLLYVQLKRLPLCIAAVATAVAVNLLVNAVFVRRFPEKTTPGILIVTAVLCIFFCNLDNSLPDYSQVDAVSVYTEFGYTLDFPAECEAGGTGCQLSCSNAYDYRSESDLSLVKTLHEKIYSDGYMTPAYGDDVGPGVEFCYTMKDGSEKYYCYRAVSMQAVTDVYELEKSDCAKELYSVENITSLTTVQDRNMNITGIISDGNALYKALVKDILTRDASKITNHSAEDEYAVLTVSLSDARVPVAAYNMWTDIMQDDPDWAEGYKITNFDTFYTFYKNLTEGNLYEYNRDAWFELNWVQYGNFFIKDKTFVIEDNSVNPIVLKAAEYYNALSDYSDNEIVLMAVSLNKAYIEDGYNIVVTKDMTATVEYIEKNLKETEEQTSEYTSVSILSSSFLECYSGINSIVISLALSESEDYTGYWNYDECKLGEYTDEGVINSILNTSSVIYAPDEDTCLAIFRTKNKVFTKFISLSDYEAIVK